MPDRAQPTKRRTSWPALLAGVLAYAAVKLSAIGLVIGIGVGDVAANPGLFLPAVLARGLSEVLALAIILVFVIGFTRISPRSGFLCAALVQAAIGWFAPMEWKDTWMRWMFGASGLDEVWSRIGVAPPFEDHGLFSGFSMTSLIACAAAGTVAQVVHNMAVRRGALQAAAH